MGWGEGVYNQPHFFGRGMKVTKIITYLGPNRFVPHAAIQICVNLGVLENWPTGRLGPEFSKALASDLPGLKAGSEDFIARMNEGDGLSLAAVIARVAVELQNMAGHEVSFFQVRPSASRTLSSTRTRSAARMVKAHGAPPSGNKRAAVSSLTAPKIGMSVGVKATVEVSVGIGVSDGKGVDVALEMSGYNDSINNAIQVVRRGGDVMLFGIPAGGQPIQIEDYASTIIFNGITLHGIIGRRVFKTWHRTKQLLEQPAVAEKMLKVVSPKPYHHNDFKEAFTEGVKRHPKIVIDWGGVS